MIHLSLQPDLMMCIRLVRQPHHSPCPMPVQPGSRRALWRAGEVFLGCPFSHSGASSDRVRSFHQGGRGRPFTDSLLAKWKRSRRSAQLERQTVVLPHLQYIIYIYIYQWDLLLTMKFVSTYPQTCPNLGPWF